MEYCNYHKHDHVSSIFTPDTHIRAEQYIKRAVELGHTTYFTTNHGSGGDIFEAKTLCDKYGIRCLFGVEGYIVPNPLEKDNRNYHIILIPRTNKARESLNLITSRANVEGYYYKPRIFLYDLLELDKDDIYITTACVAGIIRDDDGLNKIFKPLVNHFGDSVFLEVQTHDDNTQRKINTECLRLKREYGLKLIAANDSHYIYPEQAKERLEYLKGKGVNYGDEDSFILDYPDYDTMLERFRKQGVLIDQLAIEAIDNTRIFLDCEDIYLDKEIKMPSVYPGYSPEEKIKELKHHINMKFARIKRDENISGDLYKEYVRGIREEMKVIEDTFEINTADYFLFNEKNTDLAVNKYGGVLTKTGRGCFTKDAIIHTKTSMKTIDNVQVGDEVIADDCKWHKVVDTMSYDINEELIEFEYRMQGSSYKKYKNICTTDHKILVKTELGVEYIKASELKVGDLLCSPKIKHSENNNIVIDLNDYNTMGFDYDDNYIYEKVNTNIDYVYSPRYIESHCDLSRTFCRKISKSIMNLNTNNPKTRMKLKTLLDFIPFKTIENYSKYLNKHSFVVRKIPRYIELDCMWNAFIGLMYADGWTQKNNALGLAINNTTKNGFNKFVFYNIANRMGIDVYVNPAKDKNLVQLFINSHILNAWFSQCFFKSKKGVSKVFNPVLFTQSTDRLKWIYVGMLKSDGHINPRENKICYDSTSLSLISAFKTLHNIVVRNAPMAFDVRLSHDDNRGFSNAESYKLRCVLTGFHKKSFMISNDENYWYLPITKIINHSSQKTKVYDIMVENAHSYTINNIIVHNSCGSFYINRILGMTQLDRFISPIKLYPERFMSTARLLENRALPDIDFNIVSQEPFVSASRELLGEHGCYPMIAYGTMKDSEAFRNVCRSHNIPIDEYNSVAKDIESYADDPKWKPYIDEAKKYIGAIVSASVHPCAHILMNDDIRRKLGVVKIGENICVMITSSEADEYKYLKNDYLIVSCWSLISETFKMIGKPIMSIKELMSNIDDKVWDLYKNGLTCTLNQCDGEWATSLLKEYQPKNLAELSMFVASIRPSFNSWRDTYIARKEYSTGSEALDEVLKSTNSFILFQENLMQYFDWLGVSPAESIGLIKKISKKKIHQEDFDKLEGRLKAKWIENTGTDNMFAETWQMIQSCISYGFAAPHALAVAIDSLYAGYLKANYPLEYYTVCFNNYVGDESKTVKLTDELSAFGIKLLPIKFRHSSDKYNIDKENNTIYKGIASIKYMNEEVSRKLYEMRNNQFDSFVDFLKINPCDSRQTEILIKLGFFAEFGKSKKLLMIRDLYTTFGSKKQMVKDKCLAKLQKYANIDETDILFYASETSKQFKFDDINGLIAYVVEQIPDNDISIAERLSTESENIGYIQYKNPKANNYGFIMNVDTKYSPKLTIYKIDTGDTITVKMAKKEYSISGIGKNSVIKFNTEQRNKSKMVDGKWEKIPNEYDLWLVSYEIKAV